MLQVYLPGGMTIPEPSGFAFSGSSTIGNVISAALKFVFPLAGLVLFIFLILGGFEFLTAAGNQEQVKKGQGKIVSAVIGFVIIFVAYWAIQLLQAILGTEKIF